MYILTWESKLRHSTRQLKQHSTRQLIMIYSYFYRSGSEWFKVSVVHNWCIYMWEYWHVIIITSLYRHSFDVGKTLTTCVLESAIPVVETHNAVSDDLDHTYSTIQDLRPPNDLQWYILVCTLWIRTHTHNTDTCSNG